MKHIFELKQQEANLIQQLNVIRCKIELFEFLATLEYPDGVRVLDDYLLSFWWRMITKDNFQTQLYNLIERYQYCTITEGQRPEFQSQLEILIDNFPYKFP